MEYVGILIIVIGLMIGGTGWLQYNLKLHVIFLVVWVLWATASTSSDVVVLIPWIIALHYLLHWKLKKGKTYEKNIPYPTTHRDLRDIHSPDEGFIKNQGR